MSAVVQPIFTPGLDAMRQHVEHLFGGFLDGCHDGLIELAWTDTQPDSSGRYRLKNARLFGTDKIDDLIDEAARLNATPMCNVYIGAALRHPNTAPFGRSSDKDAWALTCGYVDLDDPGAATAAKDIYGLDKPTMVIVTGREPHVRAQMWWRLDEPLTDPTKWPALLRGFATKLLGDPSVTNPARVMRLAGTIAWPVKPGRTVELTSIASLKEPGRNSYAVEHLAKIFAIPPEVPRQALPPASHTLLNALATKKGEFFRQVNDRALKEASSWVPTVFGSSATLQKGTGAWRVSSKSLGRDLEEDLSIAPNGIVDFGVADLGDARSGKRTPIDIIIEYGQAGTAKDAALYLCDLMSIAPAAMGWEATSSAASNTPSAVAEIMDTSGDESEPIDVGELSGEPRPREWVVPDWIPKGVVSSLSGDGGMGKTLLAQQLLYAAGLGGKWLGIQIEPVRGLGVFCEDDEDELHRRHNSIKADLGHAIGNPFTDTWVWPRVGFDNLLVTFDKDNKPLISPFFGQILKQVLDKKIGLLILDTIADLFGGNEIIRAQVNYFIKSTCGALIKKAKEAGFVLTVILLSHPSQAGRNSGSGESGSTAWNNAVRARLYLTRPDDGLPEQRVLTRKKSNYSTSGDDVKLDLLWSDGVLKPATNSDAVAVKSIENQIIQMVGSAWEDDRPYHAKKGEGLRFLDGEMVKFFNGRVPVEVIISAIANLKNSGAIEAIRSGKKRGYTVSK